MSEHDTGHQHTDEEHAAAQKIQKLWKGRNQAIQEHMDSETRWSAAFQHTQMKITRGTQDENRNDPRARWKRALFLASRLKESNMPLEDEGLTGGDTPELKQLETQHWLELIDAKHRYGSNLKFYHRRWRDEDTKDNFFRWLDKGEGKYLSLEECPRERLEKERIKYLSAEQRTSTPAKHQSSLTDDPTLTAGLNYLIKISEDGKLLWARNDEPVDTTAGHWKDSGDGTGIIPQDAPDAVHHSPRSSFDDTRPASTSSLGSQQENQATHYTDDIKGKNKWTKFYKRHFTLKGMTNRIMRKTVRRNTWIYVTDRNFNIFIGIKETGSFQHSSFLGGSWVTSAGLISVKNGVLHTISPLSGHYRTTTEHFHQFLSHMRERGVDMRKARVSKAEAALWGIEHIGKFKKKKDKMMEKPKQLVHNVQKAPTEWKREVLEGRRKSSVADGDAAKEEESPKA